MRGGSIKMIENAEWLSKFLDSHSNMESCFDYEMEWVEKMTTEDCKKKYLFFITIQYA